MINIIIKNNLLIVIILFSTKLIAEDNFLVAIDIGHTISQPGATSARGKKEYSFNREIADIVNREINAEKQLNSFIINPNGSKISLQDRTKLASNKKANLFLSFHHDSVQPQYLKRWVYKKNKYYYSDDYRGYSIFISNKNRKNKESYELAKLLGSQLHDSGIMPTLHHAEHILGENRKLLHENTGIYEFNDLIVLKTALMPAILLECGIIVNRKDELLVSSNDYKLKIAHAVVKAILQYIKLNNQLISDYDYNSQDKSNLTKKST